MESDWCSGRKFWLKICNGAALPWSEPMRTKVDTVCVWTNRGQENLDVLIIFCHLIAKHWLGVDRSGSEQQLQQKAVLWLCWFHVLQLGTNQSLVCCSETGPLCNGTELILIATYDFVTNLKSTVSRRASENISWLNVSGKSIRCQLETAFCTVIWRACNCGSCENFPNGSKKFLEEIHLENRPTLRQEISVIFMSQWDVF